MKPASVVNFLRTLKPFLQFWKSYVIVLAPIIFLPLVLGGDGLDEKTVKSHRCGYVMAVMAAYWVTEALPLAVTSLLPLVLLPLFGIMTTDAVSKEYLKETNMMFISGIIVAVAVEHCCLHKRMALKTMLLIGASPRMLMLGFMLTTMFLSMWISNTATAAMMVPIVQAVLQVLEREDEEEFEIPSTSTNSMREHNSKVHLDETERYTRNKNRRNMIFLSVAYAANTGGTGTLTGTGPNLVLKGALDQYGDDSPINFASWMAYNVFPMLLIVFLCWIWLQMFYLGIPFRKACGKNKATDEGEKGTQSNVRDAIQILYDQMGVISFHECSVLVLFVLLVFLWVFRKPQFVFGWGDFFSISQGSYIPNVKNCTENCTYYMKTSSKDSVNDATAGMAIVMLLFMLPSKLTFWPFVKAENAQSSPSLITWSTVNKLMPWSLMFLLGGGFALAKATKESGLSELLSKELEVLNAFPSWVVVLMVVVGTAAATEISSNVATCSILMPVLNNLALTLRVNPVYMTLPVALACSYAFMLPVATPPNAIVYEASGMTTLEMIKVGFGMNVISVVVNILWLQSFGLYFFKLNEFPEWAEKFVT